MVLGAWCVVRDMRAACQVGELVAFDPSGSGQFVVGEGRTLSVFEDGDIKVGAEQGALGAGWQATGG